MKTLFAPRQVARILGIPEARVRRWSRLGLGIQPRRPRERTWLPFQSLVALRTIKALREQGVSLHQIRACLEKLRRCRPDLEEPFSQLRFSVERRRLVVSQKNRRFTPEGQLHLDFAGEPRPLTLAVALPGDLLLEALEFEQLGALDEARVKYAAILALSLRQPEALVTMGNTLYRSGFPEGAAAHYRQALAVDPRYPPAHFNLGSLLEDQGNLDGASRHYRQALEEHPNFAGACFNLARVLEKTGDAPAARRYWRRYLELEPAGEWADFLRQRLDED